MSPLGGGFRDEPLTQQRIFVTLRSTLLILQKSGYAYAKPYKLLKLFVAVSYLF